MPRKWCQKSSPFLLSSLRSLERSSLLIYSFRDFFLQIRIDLFLQVFVLPLPLELLLLDQRLVLFRSRLRIRLSFLFSFVLSSAQNFEQIRNLKFFNLNFQNLIFLPFCLFLLSKQARASPCWRPRSASVDSSFSSCRAVQFAPSVLSAALVCGTRVSCAGQVCKASQIAALILCLFLFGFRQLFWAPASPIFAHPPNLIVEKDTKS